MLKLFKLEKHIDALNYLLFISSLSLSLIGVGVGVTPRQMVRMYLIFRIILKSEIHPTIPARAVTLLLVWGLSAQSSAVFSLVEPSMQFLQIGMLLSFGLNLHFISSNRAFINILKPLKSLILFLFFCPLEVTESIGFMKYSLLVLVLFFLGSTFYQSKLNRFNYYYLRNLNFKLFSPLKDLLNNKHLSNKEITSYRRGSLSYLESQKKCNLRSTDQQARMLEQYYRTVASVVSGYYYLLLSYQHIQNHTLDIPDAPQLLQLIKTTLNLSYLLPSISSPGFRNSSESIKTSIEGLFNSMQRSNTDEYLRIYEILIICYSIVNHCEKVEPIFKTI